ncbi:MAG: DUF4079 family protein [Nitrospirota bacterium]
MIDKQTIAYLRLAHGAYNMFVVIMFFYQGSLGLKIRRKRKFKADSFKIIKRHRKLVPILAFMGIAGFFAGKILVYLDTGQFLKYPLHFIAGSLISIFIITTFLISRKIKGAESPWRTLHLSLGILIICLYLIQTFLGIGILF